MTKSFLVLLATTSCIMLTARAGQTYQRLIETPIPSIIGASEMFPGGFYEAKNIIEPITLKGFRREYASNGKGTETLIDFDFGKPLPVAAFRHIQRGSLVDSIAESELIFSEDNTFAAPKKRIPVIHVDKADGDTLLTFEPVQARFVRWKVTAQATGKSRNTGGKYIAFWSAGPIDSKPTALSLKAEPIQIVKKGQDGEATQPCELEIDSPYAHAINLSIAFTDSEPKPLLVTHGKQRIAFNIRAATTQQTGTAVIRLGDEEVLRKELLISPMLRRTIYILPHSHTDIGFTTIQTDIAEKQVNNLVQGMAEAKRTAHYPEGARFVWNVEVAWAADLLLQRLPEKMRNEFFKAVKKGQISINGMYLNNLTGLSRPEELIHLFRYATTLGKKSGVPIDSAMISDVPGYTWGTVPAMNQSGIRYFSVAPNFFDRIGDILVQWENKPFWWIGPDGESKVLVWIPYMGYATSHIWKQLNEARVRELCASFEQTGYPYDIAYLRWSGIEGDNAVPDASICDFVRDWNKAYASPQFIISSTHDAFAAFEKRYSDKLPHIKGDWSPYWEDGAGSSSAETALNRASSERLTQAQALWAMTSPQHYPVKRFEEAWNNVLLYSEHTWGAYCAINQPNIPFTTDQWTIKQSYATAANVQSRQLLNDAAQITTTLKTVQDSKALDVYNTTSFKRSEIAIFSPEMTRETSSLVDSAGKPIPIQRLRSGDCAVLVQDIPPFAGRRYTPSHEQKNTTPPSGLRITPFTIENDTLFVRLDEKTGGIVELRLKGLDKNLADATSGYALNDYLYFTGEDASKVQRSGPATITIHENGPLVASLLVTSDAPGCHQLSREIRLTATSDTIEMRNLVEKSRLLAKNYHAPDGKESLNFAFAFNVPDGEIKMDVPFGVFRPEAEQIPSACKNWLTIGNWSDIANNAFGVTWITLDAPLVQVGYLSANLIGSQTNPNVWRKKIEPSQKLFSWAMNNHWGTNYRAYQDQPVLFRFAIRPYLGRQSHAAATQSATRYAQPLLAMPGRGPAPTEQSLLTVDSADVSVTGLKPADDGDGLILRLFNTSDKPAEAILSNNSMRYTFSATDERSGKKIKNNHLTFKPYELITVRAE